MSKKTKHNSQTKEKELKSMMDEPISEEPLMLYEADDLVYGDKGSLMKDESLYKDVINFIEGHSGMKTDIGITTTIAIKSGSKLIKKFNKKIMKLKDVELTEQNEGVITHYKLLLGQLISTVKDLVDKSNENWDDWIKGNLKGISIKEIDDYLLMGRYDDSKNFIWLGEERLLLLARATEETGCENISKFLECHGVFPDTGHQFTFECDVEVYKEIIDEALEIHRIYNKCIPITDEIQEKISDMGIPLYGTEFTKKLAIVKACEGSVEEYVNKLYHKYML